MFIDTLTLRQFRNFDEGTFSFDRNFNLIVGANAQGKTNVLEAIAMVASGRSFRTSEFRDCIAWEGEGAGVVARVQGPKGVDEIAAQLTREKKHFRRNGKRARPNGPHFVLFAPEEILLLKEGPAARRKYVDAFAAGLMPTHRRLVREYERTLAQRNRLLQDERLSEAQWRDRIRPWDEQLARTGSALVRSRARWIDRLNEELPRQYRAIAPHDGAARFCYRPFCGEAPLAGDDVALQEHFSAELARRWPDECIRRTTLVGPHRDDVVAHLGESEVKRYGSQGQHRSFVLALKIAEIDIHRQDRGEIPLLLLDDVASELDEQRNRHFFDYLTQVQGQVFITATAAHDVRLSAPEGVRRYHIEAGRAAICED